MRNWIFALVALAGAAIPFQSAVNTRLKFAVESPLMSALISFLTGAVTLLILVLCGVTGRPRLAGLTEAPWWAYLGGLCGALVVSAAVIALPRIGAGSVVVISIFGQLLCAMLLDHFGLLGIPRFPLTPTRFLGVALVFIGVILTQRR
ncbi:MAG: DMT family transporter [Capsulimonas sp.]|uniref:DMT family transporter n=1 Tax=Capsulimonas sp. TaxID=2494211 RepID=UPI003265AF67